MILHCKEFLVDGNKIILGHDRISGKRYHLTPVNSESEIQDMPCYLWDSVENMNAIKSIFWIKEGIK